QVFGRGHLLARVAAHVDRPLAPGAHGEVEREDAALPLFVEDRLVGLRVDRAEALHAAEVVGAVHRAGALGRPTPIIESRVTSPARSSSLRPSVPAGRSGSTR